MLAAAPAVAAIVPAVLAFQERAVRFLSLEAGVRQFIDVGTGLPGVDPRSDLVQSVNPESRVVYVDNDPMVLSHVRAFARFVVLNLVLSGCDVPVALFVRFGFSIIVFRPRSAVRPIITGSVVATIVSLSPPTAAAAATALPMARLFFMH